MYIKIEIAPVACPRPIVTRYATYYPKRYRTWRESMSAVLSPLPTIEAEALEIDLKFIMQRPKAKYRKKDADRRYIHTKKPDIDNLIKGVLDALQKSNVIHDDAIVYKVSASKYVAKKTENAAVIIHIKRGELTDSPPNH